MKKIIKKIRSREKTLSFKEYPFYVWKTVKITLSIDAGHYIIFALSRFSRTLLSLLATFVASRILSELVLSISQGSSTPALLPLVISEGLILITMNILSSWSLLCNRHIWLKWEKWFSINKSLILESQDTDFFEDRENQKLLQKLEQKGAWALANLSEFVVYILDDLINMVAVVISVFALGPWFLIAIILSTIPRIFAELRRSKLSWEIWHEKGDNYYRHYRILDLFREKSSLTEVKLFGVKDYLLKGIAEKNIDAANRQQFINARSSFKWDSLAQLVYELTFLGINIRLVLLAIKGSVSFANFSFYMGVLNSFSSSVRNLSSTITMTSESVLYAKDFFILSENKPTIVKSAEDSIKVEKSFVPTIEFCNVSFYYKSNPKEKILDGLNLTVHPGEHLALVGENGAGKTTIIKLLLRLYDVTEGEILINGVNIKEVDLDSYWRQIGVLFQDFNQYPFDIQTNIELGKVNKKSTKAEVNRAVKLSDLDPVLDKLPNGIHTILDNSFEEGVEPSGGQWQRVALARAFYRNSNILILDEPTAAVDANAEYEIFNNIFAHYGDKTALIISHRFSTVKRAQRIVVLEKGKIIEEGSHKELMKNSKLYAEMFNKQAEGYKD